MHDRVYKTAIRDLDDLKRRLIAECSGLQQSVVDDAVDQWRKRLRYCVETGNEWPSLRTFAVTLQLELLADCLIFGYFACLCCVVLPCVA